MVLTILVVGGILFAGGRSVFVGGWHDSGDRSYACPHSPWHTVLHPLPPNAFGPLLRGIPEACNRDARRVTIAWAIGVLVAIGAAAVIVRALSRSTSAATGRS